MNREFRASKHRYFASPATAALATGPLARWSVLVLVLYLFSTTCGSSAYAQTVVDGGLTAAEFGWSLSSNLLVNGDFSQGTTGWTFSSKCFAIDPNTLAPNGAATLEMSDSGTCTSATPIAKNSLERRQRAGLHAERRNHDRRFCRPGVLRRRDVRSIRLWPFAGFDWHQRLDQRRLCSI